MPIHILAPEVASQIAAGEVIERPASVVKELIENSLDAGSTSIHVTIQEAGRRLIEISDNGSGIPGDEIALAVERHATSKLQNADDLFQIRTLGFRGEALASVGSVSRLTMISRQPSAQAGTKIQVTGGISSTAEIIGAPVGTTVRVEDLFFNVPARLKFLKQDLTERRAVDTILARYAIAYPNVRFRLTDGGSSTLQTSGDGDRRAILASIYGVEVAKQMLEVLAIESDMRLTGFISPPALTRSNRKEITFFINGRWVSDTPLSQALIQAYHTLLMVGRYPLTCLFLEIEPEEVDVNVHPAKAEVRFKSQDRVFSFVQRSARKALLAYSPVPSLPAGSSPWGNYPPTASGTGFVPQNSASATLEWEIAHDEQLTDTPQIPAEPVAHIQQSSGLNLPILRLIGQIGSTYIIAEGPDGLYLVDQHAAHERILFEKLMSQHEQRNIPAQSLLTPQVVNLPPASAKIIEDQLDVLRQLGFSVEPFGPNTFQIRSMPAIFTDTNPSAVLRAILEDFEEDETPLQAEIEAKIAGRVCKRLAIKAGKILTTEEQRSLLADLERCSSPRTCPHGRPTMIHLSVDMLERQFGRKGPR